MVIYHKHHIEVVVITWNHLSKRFKKKCFNVWKICCNDTTNIYMIVISSKDALMDCHSLHGLIIGYFQHQLYHFVIVMEFIFVDHELYSTTKEMNKITVPIPLIATMIMTSNITDSEAKIDTRCGRASDNYNVNHSDLKKKQLK